MNDSIITSSLLGLLQNPESIIETWQNIDFVLSELIIQEKKHSESNSLYILLHLWLHTRILDLRQHYYLN